MAKYQLAIADPDEGYCNRFLNYLAENENGRVKANYITNESYLAEYIGKEKTDILLINQGFYREEQDYTNAKTVIILSEGRSTVDLEHRHFVHKYQTGDALVDEILHIFEEENPMERYVEKKRGKCGIIGVYSPVTKCGKTTCSLVMAKALARSGKNVLYLNLEDYPSTEVYLPSAEPNGMSDVLYYAKTKHNHFISKLVSALNTTENGCLSYLSSSLSMADVAGVELDTWTFILNELRLNSGFDYVITDFSSKYDEKVMAQLGLCDWLLFLVSTELAEKARWKAFTRTLELTDSDILRQPQVQILNQYNPNIKFDTPKGGYGIPYMNGLVNKAQLPYEVEAESIMGRILLNLVTSFQGDSI